MTIQEDYISLETSKLLKEKGFNEPCFAYYSEYIDNWRTLKLWKRYPKTYDTVKNDGYILVPTLQMAMKWLREVHNIYIEVSISCDREDKNAKIFDASIFNIQNQRYKKFCNIQCYEQACENSIKYCLENLI